MIFQATFSLISLIAASFVSAYPVEQRSSEKRVVADGLGVGNWYQPEDHPSARLFKRQSPSTATVGSEDWQKQYPDGTPASIVPRKDWLDALRAAEAAGLIPNIPQSASGKYDKAIQPKSQEVCSSTDQCRAPGDIWDVPDGIVALSFDDGPTNATIPLLEYLKTQNQRVTHFMIGERIRENTAIFMTAFNSGNDIASHSYSHRYLTNLTNEEVVAEIGWTSQIVYDLTGGRVPRYYRPPYGDSDNRVRAITRVIFGMTQVNWNQDTDDFKLDEGTVNPEAIHENLVKWLAGPKSPGLNILEHELSAPTIKVFTDFYPLIAQNGWVAKSIPDAMGTPYYLNAKDNTGDVVSMRVGQGTAVSIPPEPTSPEPPAPETTTEAATAAAQQSSPVTNSAALPSISHGLLNISYLITVSCVFATLFS